MQCALTSKVSTVNPPKPRVRSTQPSIVQKQISLQKKFENHDELSLCVNLPLPSHVKSITSTSNPFVKHCQKLLHSSSYRHSNVTVLVVGATPIREIYRFQDSSQLKTVSLVCLLLLDEAEIPEEINGFSVRIVRVSSAVMKKLSGLQSVDSIQAIAVMKIPPSFVNLNDDQKEDCQSWFPSPHRILVLDGIQDPGNLGTLLRSAIAFGWSGVFLLPGCCDPFNEKALRASRGASFQLPIVCGSWIHLEALKSEFKMKILAGHPNGYDELKAVFQLSQELVDSLVHEPLCLVLGSEGSGLSGKSRQECELVSIPMAGVFESLNVAVAGGILLYMLRPRN